MAAGIAYFVFTAVTGLGIPCVFRKVTGLYCPGCGVTHFIHDIAALRFKSLIGDNAAVMILLPVWIAVIIAVLFRKEDGPGWQKLPYVKITAWASVAMLLIFGILRNIPAFSFLSNF